MPVQQRQIGSTRSTGLAIGGLVFGVALLVVIFAFAVPRLTESGTIQMTATSAPLNLGDAREKAALIARDGPIPFADPSGGSRDVYVQHLGDDPLTGWYVFDAHRPGAGRECWLAWATDRFVDPCGGPEVPADGAGLPHYGVEVDGDGTLWVRLVAPVTQPPGTIQVTGSSPP